MLNSEVNFLLDTGATDVAISAILARELGLRFGPQVSLQTANGVVRGNLTRLDDVSLGLVQILALDRAELLDFPSSPGFLHFVPHCRLHVI